MIKDMKDILNKKVKNREWYRPFAPIVRLQDISKYFEWEDESRWMTFAPVVREEWREKLPAITHIDNTARVQTVTREQNPYIYDLLTEMEVQTGVGVLLNTSFNVNGKPILTTVKDVFNILKNTQLDGAVIEKHFITKNRVTDEYYCLELVKKF
jgi:carbamoyltransferase